VLILIGGKTVHFLTSHPTDLLFRLVGTYPFPSSDHRLV
jgi:hypothetical protein